LCEFQVEKKAETTAFVVFDGARTIVLNKIKKYDIITIHARTVQCKVCSENNHKNFMFNRKHNQIFLKLYEFD